MWARFSACIFALVAAGILASGQSGSALSAGETGDFVIAGADGYGTTDCLAGGQPCGQIVADAWCGANGFTRAIAYRPVGESDVTGSTSRAADRAYQISCVR